MFNEIKEILSKSYGIEMSEQEVRKTYDDYMNDSLSWEYREMLQMGEEFKSFQICIGLVEFIASREES